MRRVTKRLDLEQFTLIYFNKHGSEKTKLLLAKVAKETPNANFINIDVRVEIFREDTKSISLLSGLSVSTTRKT